MKSIGADSNLLSSSHFLRRLFLSSTILGTFIFTNCTNSMEPKLENCKKICIPGPEDMVLDHSTSKPFLLVSSTQRPDGNKNDGIYAVDLDSHNHWSLTLMGDGPSTIHPHGIDLVQSESGERLLYVVSKNDMVPCGETDQIAKKQPSAIRIYKVHYEEDPDTKKHKPMALEHIGCHRPTGLTDANDITATPKGDIYVTNPTTFSTKLGIALVNLTGWKNGSVFHYLKEENQWRELIPNLSYPNGIAVVESEGQGAKLFVATTGDNKIQIFDLSPKDSDKTVQNNPPPKITEIKINRPDNLTVDREKDMLWVTSPLGSFKYLLTFANSNLTSPWAVYALDLSAPLPKHVKKIGVNDGIDLNQPTVAVPHGESLYVGQIFGSFLYRCTISDVSSTRSLPDLENSCSDVNEY